MVTELPVASLVLAAALVLPMYSFPELLLVHGYSERLRRAAGAPWNALANTSSSPELSSPVKETVES